MIFLISPAKKLDFSASAAPQLHTQPALLPESQKLVKSLARLSAPKLMDLMGISSNLAQLNFERFQEFTVPFTPENAKQALLAFKGDVYQKMEVDSYEASEFEFAQQHLRILSGLYGLLKPLDLIQPYRLEMGTRFQNRRGKNLYEFWGARITKALSQALAESGSNVLINVASNEYFKSIQSKKLAARVITPSFKDERNGVYKSIFLFVKHARGAMCDFAIKEKITDPEHLKAFEGMGYSFNESLSTEDNWVFTRKS